ncbi:unnamed protein product [Arabidopsis halleri]
MISSGSLSSGSYCASVQGLIGCISSLVLVQLLYVTLAQGKSLPSLYTHPWDMILLMIKLKH